MLWFVLVWQPSHQATFKTLHPEHFDYAFALALIQSTGIWLLPLPLLPINARSRKRFFFCHSFVRSPSIDSFFKDGYQLIVYIYIRNGDESTQPLSKFCTHNCFRSTKLELAVSSHSVAPCARRVNCNASKHLPTDPLSLFLSTRLYQRCYRHSTNFLQVECKQMIFSCLIICSNIHSKYLVHATQPLDCHVPSRRGLYGAVALSVCAHIYYHHRRIASLWADAPRCRASFPHRGALNGEIIIIINNEIDRRRNCWCSAIHLLDNLSTIQKHRTKSSFPE